MVKCLVLYPVFRSLSLLVQVPNCKFKMRWSWPSTKCVIPGSWMGSITRGVEYYDDQFDGVIRTTQQGTESVSVISVAVYAQLLLPSTSSFSSRLTHFLLF